ncbi:MAG TPA: C4-dicarboxylate ABC transporter permease [Rhodospirillaceae bacterium]|nr:C4-dicarboxylate ABC transporter permease [Magnetovibrio sp.]HCS69541.1 C4-dicarboxylate ABC transporter permease [Rhodospirillaceae bacterium]
MRHLLSVSNILKRIVTAIGNVAAWSAVLLMAVILFDVVSRRFFSVGSSELQELEWHLHTVLFMFCLGLGYVRNAHVRIDMLWENLGPRTKCWIEIIGILTFMMPFCLVVIYYGGELTHRSFIKGEVSSSTTGLPYRWLIKSAIPIGMSVLLMAGVAVLLEKIHTLWTFAQGDDDGAGSGPDLAET